jgi:hypothetical protein
MTIGPAGAPCSFQNHWPYLIGSVMGRVRWMTSVSVAASACAGAGDGALAVPSASKAGAKLAPAEGSVLGVPGGRASSARQRPVPSW